MEEKIDVVIKGTAPLLQHSWVGSEEQMANKGRRKTSGASNNEDEWKGSLYPINGGLGHPSAAIENAIISAAREFKADKRRTMKEIVKACVFADGEYMELVGKKEPDLIHRTTVVIPATGGRNFRYRPMFNAGWKMRFTLIVADTEAVPVARLKEMLDFAGCRIGLGDWRPKFGRFIVEEFKSRP